MTTTVFRLLVMGFGVRVTRLALRTLGFQRTIATCAAAPTFFSLGGKSQARWAAEIKKVSGSPYHATCLDRSVFLWFVMLQHGVDGQLRIGVSPNGEGIDGHAWIEVDGVAVNDDPDVAERFAVFDGDPIGIVFS